jgi:hypothetical protein
MVVMKMKGRDSLLTIIKYPWGNAELGHVKMRHDGLINPITPKFKTWADAVFTTRDLFEKEEGFSINDYEPMEV